ncbi:MAG: hypothetical protein HYX34_07970 [Actinobacteria bacterium]|nr:hypothetical protein [Actinomycetota bacterium]
MSAGPELELARACYVRPTPRGVQRAVRDATHDEIDGLILRLLEEPATPWLDVTTLEAVTGAEPAHAALALVHAAQEAGAIEGVERPDAEPGQLAATLPGLLAGVAPGGTALLVGPDGAPLASIGLAGDEPARLAVIGAALANAATRALETAVVPAAVSDGWGGALVDPVGVTTIGAWPLHIGGSRLLIVVAGLPRFDHGSFTSLVWALVRHLAAAPR